MIFPDLGTRGRDSMAGRGGGGGTLVSGARTGDPVVQSSWGKNDPGPVGLSYTVYCHMSGEILSSLLTVHTGVPSLPTIRHKCIHPSSPYGRLQTTDQELICTWALPPLGSLYCR